MNREEAFELIKKIILQELPEESPEITLETKFMDDLGFDSLDIVQLCVDLEDEIGVEINEGDFKFKTVTVKDIVEAVVQAKP
jgi:acyl carrier protein